MGTTVLDKFPNGFWIALAELRGIIFAKDAAHDTITDKGEHH